MQRGQLRDIPSWMARLLPEPFEGTTNSTIKMFSSKTTSSTSTFYTDLPVSDEDEAKTETNSQGNRNSRLLESQSTTSEDGNSQDSDSMGGPEDHHYSKQSFHRISNYSGFPRFQPFVMSASSPAPGCTDVDRIVEQSSESSYVKMSHSVIEYRSSR